MWDTSLYNLHGCRRLRHALDLVRVRVRVRLPLLVVLDRPRRCLADHLPSAALAPPILATTIHPLLHRHQRRVTVPRQRTRCHYFVFASMDRSRAQPVVDGGGRLALRGGLEVALAVGGEVVGAGAVGAVLLLAPVAAGVVAEQAGVELFEEGFEVQEAGGDEVGGLGDLAAENGGPGGEGRVGGAGGADGVDGLGDDGDGDAGGCERERRGG